MNNLSLKSQCCSMCNHMTSDGVWCESPGDENRWFLACWYCFQGLIYEGGFEAPLRVWSRYIEKDNRRRGSWPKTA